MKRLVGLVILVLLVLTFAALVSGCGKTTEQEGAIITPEGQLIIEKTGDEVEVTKEGTTTTWTTASASEKALGFPVPASATLVKGTAIIVEEPDAGEKWSGGTFYSDDDVNTAILFYKDKLSSMDDFRDTSTTMNGKPIGLFSIRESGVVKSVIVREANPGEKGKTWIQIATTTAQ